MLPRPWEIAHRDARRLALVFREVGGEGISLGGGWAACDVPGSWADYAAGLGQDGPVDDVTLDALVAYYRDRGRTPKIQATPYQHASLWSGLAARGFVVHEPVNVLVRDLGDLPPVPEVPGLRFRAVTSEADRRAFVDSQLMGFFAGKEPPAGMVPITGRVARAPRCRLWLAELDGVVVGSGGNELFEGTATLIAGCVHAEARRRGVQSAFIAFRLQQAVAQGCRYALVGSIPRGPTERNALRAGFWPAFTVSDLKQP